MRSFTSIGRLLAAVFVIIFIATGVGVAGDAPKVNINNATVEELTQLKRIGPKYAEKIVAFREANGPFKTADELVNVPGIGSKTVEENKNLITVEE